MATGLPGAKRSFFTVRGTVMPHRQRSRHHLLSQNKAFRRSTHLDVVDAPGQQIGGVPSDFLCG
jgi:hypothetical protein